MSVSYTHLAVYKRQLLVRVHNGTGRTAAGEVRFTGLPEGFSAELEAPAVLRLGEDLLLPLRHSVQPCIKEAILPSPVPQNGYKKPDEEKGVSDVYRHTPCSNACRLVL